MILLHLQIKASDIAFWDETFAVMKRKHERRMHPPRVKMTVSIKDSSLTDFVLPVKFVGCRDNELDTDLTLPLGIIIIYIPYSLDQTPRLLFISLSEFVRRLFESGIY